MTSGPPNATRLSLVYSDRLIAAEDVSRTIFDQVGRDIGIVFRTDKTEYGIIVPWDGVDENGARSAGRLVLHAAVAWDRVVTSGEVEIDGPGRRTASHRDEGLRATLHEIAAMGRDLVRTMTERPTFSTDETIAAILRMVDLAEGAGADDEGPMR
jgi:hypothetical protein